MGAKLLMIKDNFLIYLFLISEDMARKASSTLMDSFALVSIKGIPNESAKACNWFLLSGFGRTKNIQVCVSSKNKTESVVTGLS